MTDRTLEQLNESQQIECQNVKTTECKIDRNSIRTADRTLEQQLERVNRQNVRTKDRMLEQQNVRPTDRMLQQT